MPATKRKNAKSAAKPKAKAKTKTAAKPKKAAKKTKTAAAAAAAPAEPRHGTICHVEFTTPDLDTGAKFYADLFGWQFMPFQPTEMYFQAPGNGPCGCMLQGPPATEERTMIYVNVNDIPAALAKGGEMGAITTKQKTEIPGGHGFFAHMRTPDGNTWGIYCRK